jgi:hypothetical protein
VYGFNVERLMVGMQAVMTARWYFVRGPEGEVETSSTSNLDGKLRGID